MKKIEERGDMRVRGKMTYAYEKVRQCRKLNTLWLSAEEVTLTTVLSSRIPVRNRKRLNMFFIFYLFTFSLVALLFLLWKVKKGGVEEKELSKLNLNGPHNHFLGEYLNILELRDKTKTIKSLQKWSKIYGPIFQLNFGPFRFILLNSPNYVQKLLSSSEQAHLSKSFVYNACKPFWFDGLIISKGDKWKSRRKLLNHIVTFKSLHSYMQIYNRESLSLVNKLDQHFSIDISKPKPIEVLLMTSSLNVIMEAAMGADISKMTSIGDKSFVQCVNTCMSIVVTRILNPWLMVEWIWKLHPMSKYGMEEIARGKEYVRQTMKNNKEKKMEESSENEEKRSKSLIEDLQQAGLTEEEITGEVFTVISAGYETTATTIHLLLFLLSLHPAEQERCRQEIDNVFEDQELCPGGNLNSAALGKLKHLEKCIQETLRFYPVVPVFQRQIEAKLELEPGLVLPSNTIVTIFPQGMHMNPEYFPEPQKFKPERFCIEEVKARHPFVYIPFAAGPRMCLGYKFAMMEILILTSRILRHFVVSSNDSWDNLVFLPNITLKPETPINFRFQKRKLLNNNN
ncbi:unnamed protein product [Orchesella dallaii]|uniref:Uncharacterized protein n=1 Tax=Orchesella dallaii TaxID=48710 RepID=A0ABP1S9Z5_9HEXA